MSQVNAKILMLGQNADPTKNFRIVVPTPEDGTLTIERGNGTDVMKFLAAGGAAINGGVSAPASGMVGELLTASGGPVDIGLGAVPGNLNSLTLPAGVWDIQVLGSFLPSAAGCNLQHICGSLVSATIGSISGAVGTATVSAGINMQIAGFMARQIFTVPTTVFLVARAQGVSGTINTSGTINARRVA